MNNLSREIRERMHALEQIIQEKRKTVEVAPKGIINIAHSDKRVQYYYKDDSKDVKRKYLKKTEESLIRELCQKDYDERVLVSAEKEYTRLKMLQKIYQKGTCEDIYEKIHRDRKNYITPIVLPNDEFVLDWIQQEYIRKGFSDDYPEYYTDNGERVRSKSEILIANALKKYGVPYRYEAPLYLEGLGIIHPDFTVLNIRERKEYYWEHLGKMDDSEYVEQALHRINVYQKNNLFPGDKLILSYETYKHPINSKNIDKMINQYFR